MSVNFPITNTICKHWTNLTTYNSLPRDLQGRVNPIDMVTWPFNCIDQNGYPKMLIGWFWGKGVWEVRKIFCLPIVLVTKCAPRTVIYVRGSPLRILYDHCLDTITLAKKKKKKKKNTHPSSFFRQKLQNFPFMQIDGRNPCSMIFWYAESDRAIFIKILRIFRGVPTLSKNNFYINFHMNFLMLVAFDGFM